MFSTTLDSFAAVINYPKRSSLKKTQIYSALVLEVRNLKWRFWDFPGGPVVENLSAKAEDISSIPCLGRSHMPESNSACAPQQEKPPQWEAHLSQRRVAPIHHN